MAQPEQEEPEHGGYADRESRSEEQQSNEDTGESARSVFRRKLRAAAIGNHEFKQHKPHPQPGD